MVKSSLLKKLQKKSSKVNKPTKTKVVNVSSEDDPPWDLDNATTDVTTKAKKLGVRIRDYGESEDTDEEDLVDEEESVKFTKSMRRVSKRISSKSRPYNSPATQEIVTREALASVLRQLPKAERNYKASGAERAAYAYTNLINNARELMADLRVMSSTDALADMMIKEAVTPAFLMLVNYMVSEVSTMRSKLNGSNNIDSLRRQLNEQLNKVLKEIGEYGQETLDKANEDARKVLKS